ncbi:FtsX-like permease family protein [Kitasatospora sp. NPDC088548]|uniref:FtsX-like permease family protein n=1 Tax=Kitasatospora sp. NPDC088548 TaxID=3364075 RepID=UPI0038076CB1
MKLSAWRVALRIARRDALRAKGRSALVVAMVALPVLGVTGADIVHRSGQLTPAERVERVMGGSDALISALAPGRTVEQAPFADDGTLTRTATPGKPATPEETKGAAVEPATLVASLLPQGSVLTAARPGPEASAGSREGLLRTDTAEADLTDPVWAGRLDVVDGRAPGAPHEAAATRAFLERSGLRLGGTTAVKGLDRTPFTITGVVEHPGDLRKVELVARPGELIAPLAEARDRDRPVAGIGSADEKPVSTDAWLVRLPAGAVIDWAKVREFNAYGYTVTSRSVALDPPDRSAVPYYRDGPRYAETSARTTTAVMVATVTGMALLEVALLAGPAFAVGARRSRRQLALLAAAGGNRTHVGAVVLGAGVVLGLAGAVTGVVLGIGLVALVRPWIERAGGSRFGHFDPAPLDLAAIAGIGVATALLAAALPALQAARRSVTAGLSGRDTVNAPNRWITLLGLVMLAGGAALALYSAGSGTGMPGTPVAGGYDARTLGVLGGSVSAELGLLACTPVLISLFGRLARFLPIAARLALRDSARHRSRTAPAVAAVMAAVAGAVAVGVYTASTDAQARQDYRPQTPNGAVTLTTGVDSPDLPRLRATMEQELPDLGPRGDLYQAVYRFCANCSSTVHPKGGDRTRRFAGQGRLVVGDDAVLHNLFAVHDPAAEQALAAGKAVVFDPSYLFDGKAVFQLRGGGAPLQPGEIPAPDVQEVGVEAVLVDNPSAARYGQVLVNPATVHRLGLSAQATGAIWLPATPPDDKAQQRADAAAARLDRMAGVGVERGYQPKSDLVTLSLSGFAALVVLGAAGIATGLAAADSRHDQATLAAVGAPPRIRRTLAGLQCALIAALGAVLGTVNGFVPAMSLLKVRTAGGLDGGSAPVTAPWVLIALTALVLPVVAGLITAAFTRSRIRLTRRVS